MTEALKAADDLVFMIVVVGSAIFILVALVFGFGLYCLVT